MLQAAQMQFLFRMKAAPGHPVLLPSDRLHRLCLSRSPPALSFSIHFISVRAFIHSSRSSRVLRRPRALCGVESFFFRLHISFPVSFSIFLLWFPLHRRPTPSPGDPSGRQLPPPSFLSPEPPPSLAPASDCTCAAIIMKSKLQAVSWLLVHPC